MGRKREISRGLTAEEERLWQRVAAGVKPLRHSRAEPAAPKAQPSQQRGSPPSAVAPRPVAPPPAPAPASPESSKRSSIAGLDKRSTQRLRQGRTQIDGRIDLHGLTQAEAHHRLDSFVDQAVRRGKRCLLVITGKGSRPRRDEGFLPGPEPGILKANVPRWLRTGPHGRQVLAVEPAHLKHGGGGAYYVLLRRRRDTPE